MLLLCSIFLNKTKPVALHMLFDLECSKAIDNLLEIFTSINSPLRFSTAYPLELGRGRGHQKRMVISCLTLWSEVSSHLALCASWGQIELKWKQWKFSASSQWFILPWSFSWLHVFILHDVTFIVLWLLLKVVPASRLIDLDMNEKIIIAEWHFPLPLA